MKRFVLKGISIAILVAALVFPPVTSVFAGTTPSDTGQPGSSAGITCFSSTDTAMAPGDSMAASGSVFNPNGTAGTVYAGNPGTASLNSNNGAAVSQYDIACLQFTNH